MKGFVLMLRARTGQMLVRLAYWLHVQAAQGEFRRIEKARANARRDKCNRRRAKGAALYHRE